MQPVQNITVDDRVSRTQYQYTLEDPDANELNLWAGKLVDKMKKLPQLADVATDQQTGGLAVSLVIDRATASRLGIAPSTIDNTLYDAYGQRQINTMYTQLNQYHVILESMPSEQQSPSKLQDLYIQGNASSGASGPGASSSFSSSGSSSAGSNATTTAVAYTPTSSVLSAPSNALKSNIGISSTASNNTTTTTTPANSVPLGAFTRVIRTKEALSINHQGQFPAVTISFNLAPNAALGGAISAITKAQKDLDMPASVQYGFQGTAASFQNSLSNEAWLILAALVAVYLVLGILYESFIHPITILSTLPSAGVGALLALVIFHQDLSVVAIIGIILLIGIVKKNGIMMVDFAIAGERERGMSSTEAIYEACLLRFRPIMMTTMAALLAGIPLAVGSGMGSELRKPLGIAMVGGLLLSQILTLYTTPVIYIFFDRIAKRFSPSHKNVPDKDQPGLPEAT
jgi:multidrug efflux pump